MTYVSVAAMLTARLVFAVSFTFLITFIVLAYANPVLLDSLVHHAHEIIPAFIDRITHTIKSL